MARKKTARAGAARKNATASTRAASLAKGTAKSATRAQPKATPQARPVPTPAAKSVATPVAKSVAKSTPTTTTDAAVWMAVGQANLQACATCGEIVAKGMEYLSKEVMALAHANVEANLAATKDIMAARSLHEVITLQTGFAQDHLARAAEDTAKIGELSMQVANQAMEPLRSRLDATTQTAFRPFGL